MSLGKDTARNAEGLQKPTNVIDWLGENAANPFYNSLIAENPLVKEAWNSTAKGVNELAHKKLMQEGTANVGAAEAWGLEFWTQRIAAGLGQILPYCGAAQLTGGALRLSSKALKLGHAAKTIVLSEKTAGILGGATYNALQDPHEGETRQGKFAGGIAAFTLFEHGNALAKSLPLAARIPAMLGIGALGSVSDVASSRVVNTLSRTGKLPSWQEVTKDLDQATVEGAAMNILLPAAQHGISKGIGHVVKSANKHAPSSEASETVKTQLERSNMERSAEHKEIDITAIDGTPKERILEKGEEILRVFSDGTEVSWNRHYFYELGYKIDTTNSINVDSQLVKTLEMLCSVKRDNPWGGESHEPLVNDHMKHPESETFFERIPLGCTVLGAGKDSLVLKTRDNQALRIGKPVRRANIPEMIQPTAVENVGPFQLEYLPLCDCETTTQADVHKMEQMLAKRITPDAPNGYEFSDPGPDNIGFLPDGRLVVVDAGGVARRRQD